MRILAIILIVLGILIMTYQGFTFFTTERVAEAGPFHIDMNKPHTIIVHPVVGIISLVVGIIMLFAGRGPRDL